MYIFKHNAHISNSFAVHLMLGICAFYLNILENFSWLEMQRTLLLKIHVNPINFSLSRVESP